MHSSGILSLTVHCELTPVLYLIFRQVCILECVMYWHRWPWVLIPCYFRGWYVFIPAKWLIWLFSWFWWAAFVKLRSHYMTFKVMRLLHCSHYTTCCLIIGSLEVVVFTLHDWLATWGHTLQDLWLGGIPNKIERKRNGRRWTIARNINSKHKHTHFGEHSSAARLCLQPIPCALIGCSSLIKCPTSSDMKHDNIWAQKIEY